MNSRDDRTRLVIRLMRGTHAGRAVLTRLTTSKTRFDRRSSSSHDRQPGQRILARLDGQAGVALGQHPIRVREPVELEVVRAVDEGVEVRQGARQGPGILPGPQQEGRHALQGQLRDDAEGAQADPGRLEQVRLVVGVAVVHRSVGEHDPDAAHGIGQAAESCSRAVGARAERAADGLPVDVPEVRHRQPDRGQRVVQLVERRARAHADDPAAARRH